MSRPTLLFTALKSDFKSFRYICDATCTNYNIVQIFPSNVLIIQKYSTNIPQIFFRYLTNIMVIIDKQQIKVEQWLDQKYGSNIFHYFRIIQIFLQMIYKYWTNIMKTMWKYSTVSILWKHPVFSLLIPFNIGLFIGFYTFCGILNCLIRLVMDKETCPSW